MKLSSAAVFTSGPIQADVTRHMAVFSEIVPETEVRFVKNVEELRRWRSDVEAIFTMPIGLAEIAEYCGGNGSFKWLQLLIAGCDTLKNTPFINMDNVVITSTHGIHADPISDHVLAFLLAFLRGLPEALANKKACRWAFPEAELDEMCNKTVGIIGRGPIGVGVAEKLKKLDFKVLCCGAEKIDCPWIDEFYVTERLGDMLAHSDFAVVCAPLKESTYHMMGREQFKAMKRSAFFINVGRGAIHDQNALIDALRNGEIAGAGLDVTDPEPLPPDNPLWDMENVIITSHCAATSKYYTDRAMSSIAENIRKYNAGERLPYIFKDAANTR